MKNGDLWQHFYVSTATKGLQAVTLSKVKGHATQQMVDEGEVEAKHKEGNDRADKVAEEGVVDMQLDLSTEAGKYAWR